MATVRGACIELFSQDRVNKINNANQTILLPCLLAEWEDPASLGI